MSTFQKIMVSRKKRLLAIATAILLIGLVWMMQPRPALAQSGDLESIEAHYPIIEGSRIDTCALCHSSVPSLNPFGQAYKSNGRNDAAFTAIQGLDSDGDGFTNLQEINALTFPGNASDQPALSTSTSTTVPTATATRTATLGPTATATRTATAGPTATARPTAVPGSLLSFFIPLIGNQGTP